MHERYVFNRLCQIVSVSKHWAAALRLRFLNTRTALSWTFESLSNVWLTARVSQVKRKKLTRQSILVFTDLQCFAHYAVTKQKEDSNSLFLSHHNQFNFAGIIKAAVWMWLCVISPYCTHFTTVDASVIIEELSLLGCINYFQWFFSVLLWSIVWLRQGLKQGGNTHTFCMLRDLIADTFFLCLFLFSLIHDLYYLKPFHC